MPVTHDLVYFFRGALLQLFFLGHETFVSLGENEKAIFFASHLREKRGVAASY